MSNRIEKSKKEREKDMIDALKTNFMNIKSEAEKIDKLVKELDKVMMEIKDEFDKGKEQNG
ncbi:MAG: hypothetical protein ACRCX2_23055 [Paraclostridium sp.]